MKRIVLQSRRVRKVCSVLAGRAAPHSLSVVADPRSHEHNYWLHNLTIDQQSQQLEAEKNWKTRRKTREEWRVPQLIEETELELKENLKSRKRNRQNE